jgi:hypothetical protein
MRVLIRLTAPDKDRPFQPSFLCRDQRGAASLLANRPALKAATTTSKLEARLVRETEIRDAYRLTPSGEARGPDGDLLEFWREHGSNYTA